MPAHPPRFLTPSSAGSSQRRLDAPVAPLAQPMAALSAIEADFASTRAEYTARRYESVRQRLEEIEKRIDSAKEGLPPEMESAYAVVEASINTLRGRLLGHRDQRASREAFERAVSLFEKYSAEVERHRGRIRLWTDWGIALHRLGRTGESIALLNKVCASGTAPAEAFGYLAYGELARNRLEAAEQELRKGLGITPADSTMNFYLGRVLDAISWRTAVAERPEKAAEKRNAAVEAYRRAGEIARGVEDYSLAGRCGLWALRLEPADAHALWIATESYRRLGRFRLALLIVERFLRQPQVQSLPIALGMKGMLLRDCENAKASVEVLRSVSVNTPDLAWIRAELAQSLRIADAANADEALRVAQDAAVLAPEDPFVHTVIANLAMDRGNYDQAVSSLRRVRELDPSSDVALELGGALFDCGRYAEAAEELKTAVAANPRSIEAHFFLGLCSERLGKSELALNEYRKAAHLDPNNPDFFAAIMNLLGSTEFRAQALDEIEERLDGPLSHLALWYKGRFEIADESWEAALRSLTTAAKAATGIHSDADLLGILVDLGDTLRQTGRYAEALQTYTRALGLNGSRPDALIGIALWHCDTAGYSQALEYLKQALSRPTEDPSDASCWDLQGWCLQHSGDLTEAQKAYQKAFDLSREENPWYLKGVANVEMNFSPIEAKKKFGEILKKLKYHAGPEPVTERPSGNASTLGLLGWCNYRLERYEEAIRLFQLAVASTGDNPSVLFDLALSFLASKRLELALGAYQQGHDIVERGELPRRRGLYYIALFDLADARRLKVVGAESDRIFAMVREWLRLSGVPLESLSWLPGAAAV